MFFKKKVYIQLLEDGISMPLYTTEGAAGCDVCANMDAVIMPGEVKLIKTGIALAIPKGYEVQVRSRSGLALKKSIFVLNSPGTIDCDYRGEVGVILANFGKETFVVSKGDRIAQLVLTKYNRAEFVLTNVLSKLTQRGAGGFGHTGV